MPSNYPFSLDNLPTNHTDFTNEPINAAGNGGYNHMAEAINALESGTIAGGSNQPFYIVDTYKQAGDPDDTLAFRRCYVAAAPNRGIMVCLPRVYTVTPDGDGQSLGGGYCIYHDTYDYPHLVGAGGLNFSTTIRSTTHTFTGIFSVGKFANRVVQCPQYEGICVQGDNGSATYPTTTGVAFDLRATQVRMDNVTVQYIGGAAFIRFTMSGTQQSFDNTFKDMYLYAPLTDTTDGFFLDGGSTGSITDCEFDTVKSSGTKAGGGAKGGRYGFNFNGILSGGYQITNCHPYFWANAGYNLNGVGNILIHGGQCESCGGSGGNGGIVSIQSRLVDIHDVLFYGNYGVDIQVNWNSTGFDIHDNIFNGGQNSFDTTSTTLTRNIYVSSGAGIGFDTSDIQIANNRFFHGNATGMFANVQLDTGSSHCRVLSNKFDTLLTESGTTTGSRYNIFGRWNDGPSVTIVDSSSIIESASGTATFMDVFGGALDHAWDPDPSIPTAPQMTLDAQAEKFNVPPCIALLRESPPVSLQTQVNNAPAGSTLTVAPGYVYRESVTIGKALTIDGGFAASLRGTDNWSTGGPSGNTWSGTGPWTSSLTIPSMTTDSTTNSPLDTYSQNHREIVFVDDVGIPLVNATPTAGQWQLDGSRHVVLGSNPSGHKIEVCTRNSVITLSGNNDFILKKMDLRQVGTSGTGPPAIIDSSGVTTAKCWIKQCMIGWCHGTGLNLGGMTRPLVQDTILHHCGTCALAMSSDVSPFVHRCIFFNNGLTLYGWDPGFSDGGAKIAGSDGGHYNSCIAFNNHGVGLWFDVYCTRSGFENCIAWDAWLSGGQGFNLMYEISSYGLYKNNIIFRTPNRNGGLTDNDLGIFISNSRWVDMVGNLVMHCPINMKLLYDPTRSNSPPSPGSTNTTQMGGLTVHGNKIIGRYHANSISGVNPCSDLAISYNDNGTGTYTSAVTSNTGGVLPGTSVADGNVYGWPALVDSGVNALEVQQEPDSRWWYDTSGVTQISTIANWISALSGRLGANSRYMLDSERVAYLDRFGLVS